MLANSCIKALNIITKNGNGSSHQNTSSFASNIIIFNEIYRVFCFDNIQKKLKLNNVGEDDRLIIEGDVFKYQALEDPETRSQLKDFGIIVNLIDNN